MGRVCATARPVAAPPRLCAADQTTRTRAGGRLERARLGRGEGTSQGEDMGFCLSLCVYVCVCLYILRVSVYS